MIYLALVIVTLIAFEPVRHNEFVDYDDNLYITENYHVKTGITPQSIVWAFTTTHTGYWHPLTWLSHMLDCQLFDLNPLGHHLTSLIFHIANTLLLFWILKKTTSRIWPAAFVAAAFALHPLHVESVAWIAERKDVLSSFFFMATITFYIRYAQRPCIKRYLLVFFALCLGLMAKPMLVTLPFVLLLLDYWPLQRFQWPNQDNHQTAQQYDSVGIICKQASLRRLITEKIPLFVLIIVSSVTTLIAQRVEGAMANLEQVPIVFRIANSMTSYVTYIGKMIYPNRLAVLYPFHRFPLWYGVVCIIILAWVSKGIIHAAHRRRYLVTGWLWYIGILVPVIGLVQVGSQAIADRYTYLPSIGIFIIIAWGAVELTAKWRYRKIILNTCAVLTLTAMLVCTRHQLQFWQNSTILFGHTLAVTENNFIMHERYGTSLLKKDLPDEAIEHYRTAIRLKPQFFQAWNNMGGAFLKKKKGDEAITCFKEALKIQPDSPKTHTALALAYDRRGSHKLADIHWIKVLQIDPDNHLANLNVGIAKNRQNKSTQALEYFNKALQTKPDSPEILDNLAKASYMQGKTNEAVSYWRKALDIDPDYIDALNNLAWIYAENKQGSFYNPNQALQLAKRACKLTEYNRADFLDTLAVAYAATDNFVKAIETAQKAINLANEVGETDLADEIQDRLRLYKTNRAFIEPLPKDNDIDE